MGRIFSIGYADHSPGTLIAVLRKHGIKTLADVRTNPVSRERGFSKRQLQEALRSFGIDYLSVPQLGIPSSDRKGSSAAATDLKTLLTEYGKSLDNGEVRGTTAKELSEHCRMSPTAVLCLESDLARCHRKPLSEWISVQTGLELVHL